MVRGGARKPRGSLIVPVDLSVQIGGPISTISQTGVNLRPSHYVNGCEDSQPSRIDIQVSIYSPANYVCFWVEIGRERRLLKPSASDRSVSPLK